MHGPLALRFAPAIALVSVLSCSPGAGSGSSAASDAGREPTGASPDSGAAVSVVDAAGGENLAPDDAGALGGGPGAARPLDGGWDRVDASLGAPPIVVIDWGDAGPDAADAADAHPPVSALDAADGAPPAGLDPELSQRLLSYSARLAVLADRTWAFWRDHGEDSVEGGFHGTLDRAGALASPDDKGLIQQARHLWAVSTWYERREPTPAVAALAERTYAFVRDAFVGDDGFVFKVSRDGSNVVDDKRQMFAECYAIYALSTYGRVLGVEPALALALDTFDSIDARAHDAAFGGYDQRGDPGFLAAGSDKGANTHLHLLEAFTSLYEATGDELVAVRLDELADLMAGTLLRPPGYVHAQFALDWTPLGVPEVSYGHDLETAWLLLDAGRVLGRGSDAVLRAAALQMAGGAGTQGFDAALGGYFERGQPGGAVSSRQKVWWVQLEALLGLWAAYELNPDSEYLDRFEATLGWTETTEDLPAGEWFATRTAEGALSGADYKGDEWKASYHVIRAFVFAQDRIDAYRAAPQAPR